MQRVRRKKVRVLKKWVRVAIILVLFFIAGLSAYLIFSGFVPTIHNKIYYNYDISRNVDYKVYLKKNDFYKEEFLPSGMQYPSALIDYIDVTFWFNYGDSKATDFEYTYSITGKLVGEYEDSISGKQEILTKDYVYVNEQDHSSRGTEINLNKKIRINYDEYNDFVTEYKNSLRLAIDAYLEVKGDVKYKSKLDGEAVSGHDELVIKIPLAKAAINIDTTFDDRESESLINKIIKYDYIRIYIGFILAVGFIVIFIELRDKLFINDKTIYSKTLDKILKDYSDIIATTSTPIELDDLTVYDIADFDDMVDIEEELKSPILLYEVIPGRLSQFVVIKNGYAYRYVLKVNEKKV